MVEKRKIFERAGTVILVLSVLLAVAVLISFFVFGWRTYTVSSGSMEPTFKTGGLIITKPVVLGEIKKGDIISFRTKEVQVTHRVVDIIEYQGKTWFQTKGDVNEEPDSNLVSSGEGKITKVIFRLPYLGHFVNFVRSKAGLVLIIVLAATLIAMEARDIQKEILRRKRK